MQNNQQNELKVIVKGEPDLSLVPESLMDAFIAAIVEEIGKFNRKSNGENWFSYYKLPTKVWRNSSTKLSLIYTILSTDRSFVIYYFNI